MGLTQSHLNDLNFILLKVIYYLRECTHIAHLIYLHLLFVQTYLAYISSPPSENHTFLGNSCVMISPTFYIGDEMVLNSTCLEEFR